VFLTPTWVSGALRMPRNTFLVWNAFAAIASTCIAALGAYGIRSAVLGQLSSRRGAIALAVAALTLALALAAVATAVRHHRRTDDANGGSAESPPKQLTQ
jgi:membrane protein DedA with SNARE-associated domain